MKKCCFYLIFLFFSISLFSQNALPKDNITDNASESNEMRDDLKNENNKEDAKNEDDQQENVDKNIVQIESLESKNIMSKENASFEKLKDSSVKINVPRKIPAIAVTANIIPGLGHFYLEDYKTASALFGSALLGIAAMRNDKTEIYGSYTLETSLFYGIYAAYRDVRLYNKNVGFKYPMPTDSFKDLCYAPFNYKVLKKPEVWGGLLADLALAAGICYLYDKFDRRMLHKTSTDDFSPLLAFPVGISEESLFRGYIQSALSEPFTPTGGIILSSLAFGAAHITNVVGDPEISHREKQMYYRVSIPFITLGGAYYGWVTYKNHSLKESVALHSWYDFILFSLSWLAKENPENKILRHKIFKRKTDFSFGFSF